MSLHNLPGVQGYNSSLMKCYSGDAVQLENERKNKHKQMLD